MNQKGVLPKTIVISGTGLIGKAFLASYRETYPDCIGTTRNKSNSELKYLDLLCCDISPLKLAESGYKDAVISAGISKLSKCELEKEFTRRMTDGTVHLIKQLVDEGIKPIYISSDCVFDGRDGNYDDDASLNPLNEYGKHKAEIEQKVKEVSKGNYLIARLSKVFTLKKGDGTIFDEMASVLSSGGTIRAAYDQIFSVTLLDDAVNAVKALQMNDARGTFNICSPEVWSRYELALKMADCLSVSPDKVKKISLDDLHENFKRPKNSSLATGKFTKGTRYKFTPTIRCVEQVSENWKECILENRE